jgi:hypothetical protein
MELARRKAIELLETLTEVRAIAKVIKNENWFHYEDMITAMFKEIEDQGWSDGHEIGYSEGYSDAKEEVSENDRSD